MPIQSRTQLINIFKNGNKPSETDFEDWLNSFVHLSDPLDTVVPRATQPEAEAGIDNNKVITPFTLVQTISALVRLANLGDLNTDVQGLIDTAIADLKGAAPATLDALNELADALGNDPNFATTMLNSLAAKLNLSGGAMTGDIAMGSNKVTGLDDGTANGDAVNLGQLNTKLNLSGGAMTGALAMGTNKITGLDDGTSDGDAVNLGQLNTAAPLIPIFADIPVWNMYNNSGVYNFNHGLGAEWVKIKHVEVMIYKNADASSSPLNSISSPDILNGGVTQISNTFITLFRNSAGIFDSTNYNAARAEITIWRLP